VAELRIDRVSTRDIDMLVAENIVKNPEFARLFLGSKETGPLSLVSLKYWQDDGYGKPDMTAVFQTENGRVMLLLANNVAKMTRKSNQEKMQREGEANVQKGLCDRYRCCILAPRIDLVANREELEGFPVVSYDIVKEALAKDPWGEFVMHRGIADRPVAYSAKTNAVVVDFWEKYFKHVKSAYPDLNMERLREKVGFQSTTVHFTTSAPGVSIYHKAQEGVVDVMMKLKQHDYKYFEESFRPFLFAGMKTKPSKKDALIYMEVPVIDFGGDFNAQLEDLDKVLESVVQMQEFMEELDYGGVEQILNDGPAAGDDVVIREADEELS
jgi:hypothetical protein